MIPESGDISVYSNLNLVCKHMTIFGGVFLNSQHLTLFLFFITVTLFSKHLFILLGCIESFFLFLAAVGLRCCLGFSLAAASRAYSLVVVHRLLIARLLFLWSLGSRCRE